MKYLVLMSACVALSAALPQRRAGARNEPLQPLQPAADQQPAEQNYDNYQSQPQPQPQDFRQHKTVEQELRQRAQLETTTWIPIIRFDKEQGTDGSYKTAYETGNHIQAEETGFLKNVGENHEALVQHGTYSYTSPEGQIITVEYTADELGFRVKGDHIPTPPPVSPEIQKGLDLIYAGIKANAERTALEAKDPATARANEERQALDYKGLYYQQ